MPDGLDILVTVILLDFRHLLATRPGASNVSILWRFHIVHHSDLDLDVSSGFRFHPVEIILSMLYKIGIVFLLGPSVTGVIVFERCSMAWRDSPTRISVFHWGLDRALRCC